MRSTPSQNSFKGFDYRTSECTRESDCANAQTSGEGSVKAEEVEYVPSFNLPLLVRAVGAILACSAGLINSVAFFELGWFVSHHTGTLSKVGFGQLEALAVLCSFVAGSVACGLLIAKDTVHIGLALYDFGLLSISGLLVATTLCHHNPYAKFFAAAACGLQNGMATFWGGTVVRLAGAYGYGRPALNTWILENIKRDRDAGHIQYPPAFGQAPLLQTRDLQQLPFGYGRGSGTIRRWLLDKAQELLGATDAVYDEVVASKTPKTIVN